MGLGGAVGLWPWPHMGPGCGLSPLPPPTGGPSFSGSQGPAPRPPEPPSTCDLLLTLTFTGSGGGHPFIPPRTFSYLSVARPSKAHRRVGVCMFVCIHVCACMSECVCLSVYVCSYFVLCAVFVCTCVFYYVCVYLIKHIVIMLLGSTWESLGPGRSPWTFVVKSTCGFAELQLPRLCRAWKLSWAEWPRARTCCWTDVGGCERGPGLLLAGWGPGRGSS